jgi:hypothetical protein
MNELNADVTDAVATVKRLFEELDREWGNESGRIRTWHQITERVADIDKVIRRPQAVS